MNRDKPEAEAEAEPEVPETLCASCSKLTVCVIGRESAVALAAGWAVIIGGCSEFLAGERDYENAGRVMALTEPCPHPGRGGRHEEYLVDGARVCRACGAHE